MDRLNVIPTHTPYDGSSKLFAIGLKPLDFADWIEVGSDFDVQMHEKRRLQSAHRGQVFVAEDGTHDAQAEVLQLLLEHLPIRFPDTYRVSPGCVEIAGQPTLSAAVMNAMAPLHAAALLVQEDLILMRQGADGWRLAAGSLCFPSSWTLTEKFGKPMHEIHGPVPDFGAGTRMAELIARMFDRLQPGNPVQRFNWSIQAKPDLYHPLSNDGRNSRAVDAKSKFPNADPRAHAFIRVERQTLRKLPRSGDILFTIRIHLDPLAVLARHPDRATLAPAFAAQLTALDRAQLDYKGLTADRDRLVPILDEMAKG